MSVHLVLMLVIPMPHVQIQRDHLLAFVSLDSVDLDYSVQVQALVYFLFDIS